MATKPITVTGLAQFGVSLKRFAGSTPKMEQEAMNGCSDLFVSKVRPLVPQRSGAARRSVKKTKARGKIRVEAGGRAAPYFPWLDFGGRVGRKKSVQRQYISQGRYVFPTLKKHQKDFQAIAEEAMPRSAQDWM